ncbi:MAG: hypothetical protein Q7R85_02180 [bacterium]|nr:hypothetical protein [bacterium]
MPQETKKIYVNKNDDAAVVAEKVIDAEGSLVVLHVPRFSRLAQSENNFHLLRRESEALKKTLRIESVDDAVVALAKAASIEAENPFFSRVGRPVADIVTLPKPRRVKLRNIVPEASPQIAEAEDEAPSPERAQATLVGSTEEVVQELNRQFGPMDEEHQKRHGKMWLAALMLVGCSSVAAFLGLRVLPRAEIHIVTQKTEWAYSDAMVADKGIAAPDAEAGKIPGQLFTEKRNVTLTFPATGHRQVTTKASGSITISNAYSSDAQKLVATTRFVTPDGKIFRLTNNVTVPGAKIADGKIVSSSIVAGVIADKAGEEYNVAGGVALTIPGLKGTPKYEAFRGETKEAMRGGFVGEAAYPTDGDIKTAKDGIATTLADGLKAAVLAKVPQAFKVLDGSTKFRVVKQTVDTAVNAAGQFSITAEAEVSAMGIREADALTALHGRIAKEIVGEHEVKREALKYGTARFDVGAGRMTVPLDYSATVARKVNVDELRGNVLLKSERDLRAMVLNISGLLSARITLWPFWVRTVPGDGAKVKISVE